jgi:hypothetical protein
MLLETQPTASHGRTPSAGRPATPPGMLANTAMSRKSISRAKPSEPAFTGSKAGSTTNTVPLRHQSALLDEVIINYWRMQQLLAYAAGSRPGVQHIERRVAQPQAAHPLFPLTHQSRRSFYRPSTSSEESQEKGRAHAFSCSGAYGGHRKKWP